MKLAIDTNLVIYFFDETSEFFDASAAIFRAVERSQLAIVASELLFAEMLAHSMDELTAEDLLIDLLNMETGHDLKFLPVSRAVLLHAAALRRQFRLRMPDAIHVASAIEAKVPYFVTNDKALLKLRMPYLEILSMQEACKKLSVS